MATPWDTALTRIAAAAAEKPNTSRLRIRELQDAHQVLIDACVGLPDLTVTVPLDAVLALGFGPVAGGKRGLYVRLPGDVIVSVFSQDPATMLAAHAALPTLLTAIEQALAALPAVPSTPANVRG